VASYDNVVEAAAFTPALTTVATPRRAVGRRAGELLENWPTDGSLPDSVVLPSHLVVGASTRAPTP
jgi:DNA-binding LacI/PurR family transcriptional regulator